MYKKLNELYYGPDIVVEATAPNPLKALALPILQAGVDLVSLSVGAYADDEFAAPYFFQTAWNDKSYSRGHAQLRNSNTTAILLSEKGLFSFLGN